MLATKIKKWNDMRSRQVQAYLWKNRASSSFGRIPVAISRQSKLRRRKNVTGTIKPQTFVTPLGRAFPGCVQMKFHYDQFYEKSVGNLGVGYEQFRLNSIYDPNIAAEFSGLRATPWVEMNALYQEYQVQGALVEIVFGLQKAQNNMSVVVKAANQSYSAAPTLNNAFAYGPYYRSYLLTAGNSTATYKQYIDLTSISGIDRDDQDNQSVFSNNPATTAALLLHFSAEEEGGSTVQYHVHITYYTKCFKPKVQDA